MVDMTDPELVRLLISDTDTEDPLFSDAEIAGFLALEGDSVKRAAAQALDTLASNEALVSKVIRTQDLQTDGPKTAAALREHAARLRAQADTSDDEAEDGGYAEFIPMNGTSCGPELADWWP